MTRLAVVKVDNCLDCPHHKRMTSPYTGDSFDMGDEDVICTNPNVQPRRMRQGQRDKVEGRAIVVSERWNLRKECVVPSWCPLKEEK